MSQIKISSSIEKILDGSFGSGTKLINQFSSENGNAPETFVADYCLMDTWVLDNTQGTSFAENILRVIDSTVTSAEVTFIHIQAYKKENLPGDRPSPIRFEVVWGGNSLGKMSQFQTANCKISPNDVVVSNIEIPVDTEAVLAVVIGFNKN